ncbi:hypothetical protein [Enhygromyxa salina]|uniref:hypothetical protein n=1 Tax=Enhygromyxa salina TaxID=215803 RepID=UPI0011B23E8E|nr:hypothetical protein [Enhygromyxa salina]
MFLSLVPALLLVVGCGDDEPNQFEATATDGSGTATDTGAPADLPAETEETGSADGETGETGETGDGDSGDGDGDPGETGTDTGAGVCGDGVVDIGEQCDGLDLNGFTCEDLGYATGQLGCDPVTCTYDAAACMTDMDGGGSGGTTG